MAVMDINPKLGNERVSESELRQSIHSDRELADTLNPDAKLRNGYDTAGKLTDCNNALCRYGDTVWSVLEGYVQ